jgi:hypothetical protein
MLERVDMPPHQTSGCLPLETRHRFERLRRLNMDTLVSLGCIQRRAKILSQHRRAGATAEGEDGRPTPQRQ